MMVTLSKNCQPSPLSFIIITNEVNRGKGLSLKESEEGSPVQFRRGPATVNGEDGRRMPLSRDAMGRRGQTMIHEPGDLPFPIVHLRSPSRMRKDACARLAVDRFFRMPFSVLCLE
jgi:hypothetical protein